MNDTFNGTVGKFDRVFDGENVLGSCLIDVL